MITEMTLRKKKRSVKSIVAKTLIYALLAVLSLMMLVPFFWMLSTSFKGKGEVFTIPIFWIPKKWTWSNYPEVFKVSRYANFLLGFRNTLIIAIPTVVISVLVSSLAAFAFAKIDFKGRNQVFFGFIVTMAIPSVMTMIPSYMLFVDIGWSDSWKPLMIPAFFGSFGTAFFTRQYMKTIPKSLDEAAMVDGMNWWQIFWKIELPLAKPILVTNLLMGFIGAYNDYLGPMMYIRSADKFTLQLALSAMNDSYSNNWGVAMAGSTIALIPTVLIFFVAQNFFIEGITITGIKG